MIDLTKKKLQNSIIIDNEVFEIKTDFRYWLRFLEIINQVDATLQDLDFLYIDDVPKDRLKGLQELVKFAYPKEELPNREYCEQSDVIMFDYKIDGSMIFASFWQCYKIDLTEIDLHFHKFLALFNSLQNTRLNEIMSYRSYKKDNESYETRMRRLQNQWEISEFDTEQEQEIIDKFNSQFD